MTRLRKMTAADVDEVARIEQSVHRYPWTRGSFVDALNAGYLCMVYEGDGGTLGYTVLMPAVDEVQLLDIAIAAEHQRKGYGHRLLNEVLEIARNMRMRRILLEVRPSNVAALALYQAAGFHQIGLRRGYYAGTGQQREDAIVMECVL